MFRVVLGEHDRSIQSGDEIVRQISTITIVRNIMLPYTLSYNELQTV